MNTTRSLVWFFGLAFGFTWFFWGLAFLDGSGVIALPFPRELLGIIGAFGPSAVGLWFLVRFRKRSFKSVIKETFFYRADAGTAFLTFALMPGILGISYLITRFLFGVEYALEWFEAPWMIPVVFLYILFLGGPLGEEIGWRGYALPGLLTKHNPFVASLILGLVWTFWHVPAFFIPDSAQEGISFPLYLVNTMILTMILTILYLRTKRISSALYFHTSANFALGIFYIIDQTSALVFIGIFMVLTLLTLLYKERERMFKRPSPL